VSNRSVENTTKRFAIDGLGGSGKSHVIRLLKDALSQQGSSAEVHKIGGLGESSRVQRLKCIQEFRTQEKKDKRETPKHAKDQSQDRLFRLAIKEQVRKFLLANNDTIPNTTTLFDRTPLMSWVFIMASDPSNTHANKILEECLVTTGKLAIDTIFLLDVDETTAYARMIARYCVNRPDCDELIQSACEAIDADQGTIELITKKVKLLLQNSGKLQQKPFESWDLIPLNVTQRERQYHSQALTLAREKIGINSVIVNAESPIEIVVNQLLQHVQKGGE
jgi:thymidylate kinase